MPRNSSGIYNPPAGTFAVSGAVISSTAYDAFLTDLSNEISASVNTSGTAAMIAPLNLGSQKIINVAAGSNQTDVATLQNLSGAGTGIVPAGTVVMFAAGAVGYAPPGWYNCNGQAISRSTNPNLFSVIGTSYGTGDGSTTFNVPNFLDRSPIAAGNTYGNGGQYGSSTQTLAIANLAAHSHTDSGHTHTDSGHTHTINQGAHNHTATDSGHTHTFGGSFGGAAPGAGSAIINTGTSTTGTGSANISVSNTTISISNNIGNAAIASSNANIQNTGSGSAFSILHAVFGIYFIIKAG